MKNHKIKRSNPNRRYNWRPDLPDQRDFLFRLAPVGPQFVPEKLPKHVDLRPNCSPVEDQGHIGSCTGNALVGALEFLELKTVKTKFVDLSRLFIYYNERLLEGHTNQDSGATLRDGVKALAKWGVCPETQWKYTESNVLKKPPARAYTDAKDHAISRYVRLQTLDEMKHCIAHGFPFAFGFSVYESFESAEVARTGVMPFPTSTERLLGGHAVLAVGYDDDSRRFFVRNSWGKSWGMDGYFTMPYEVVEKPSLATDFWVVER